MSVTIKKEFSNTRSRKPDLSTLVYGKVPPQAPELEEAVLGACMLEKDAFEQVLEIIPSHECFYLDNHQKIYEAMCLLYNSGSKVDALTVCEQLSKMSSLEIVGGRHAISKITEAVVTGAHIRIHSFIVMEKFMQREVIRICGSAINDAYEDSTDVFELMNDLEMQVKSITDGIIGGTDITVGVTYGKMLEVMQRQREMRTDVIGVKSGYDELDRMTLGFQKTDLIILAARPSQGKTAVAVNFAVNAEVPTLIFSLESTNIPLVRRMAAAKNSIPLKDIRRGCVDIDQFDKMKAAQIEFHKLPIKIDSKSRSLSSIKKVARKWVKAQRKINPDAELEIIIDYLQLMTVSGKGNREQEIATISRDLKELATELEVPIIALSQLNREIEKTATKKPNLSHLRESGALEQDANVVMFIWWETTSENDALGNPVMKTWIVIAKNRDGECGDVQLKFNGDLQKWMNMEEQTAAISASYVKASYQNSRNPSEPETKWDDY